MLKDTSPNRTHVNFWIADSPIIENGGMKR
jgi:hypothetical protein